MVWQKGQLLQGGKYEIIDVLGRGGFGVTYKAKHRELDTEVVIKTPDILQKKDIEYPTYVQKFIAEGRKLARFSVKPHPHIVRVRDYFLEAQFPCLVMDFVEGETLMEIVKRRGRLSERECLTYICQIGNALATIHQGGIVHRDAHPGNIMIQSDGNAVLIDFGIAKDIIPATQSVTDKAANPRFAPYEQIFKGNRQPSVDVYALAASFYYAVTGKRPTPSMERKLDENSILIPPKQINRQLSDHVNEAILQGMALEKENRPQSMSSWLQLLEPLQPPSVQGKPRKGFVNPTSTPKKIGANIFQKFVHNQPDKLVVKSAWANGLFYLFVFIIVVSSIGFFGGYLPFAILCLVIIAGILFVPLIGALQLRQDDRLSEESFLKLMRMVIRQLPLMLKYKSSAISLLLFPSPSPSLSSSSYPPPPPGKQLLTYKFDVITVNSRGEEINRENKQAKYFTVDLGKGVTMEMVAIPGGKFIMGFPATEKGRSDEESPQREVTIPPFYMGKYQVTQAQWQAVMSNNPSYFKGANNPVEQVSWNDCVEFCKKLSEKTGLTFRLPSEAEWEYGCRAGTTTPFHFGATLTSKLANYNANYTYAEEAKGEYRQKTTEVGSFTPNAFGLYDMHGNVCEWCQDDYHANYNGAPTDGSAWIDNDNRSQNTTKIIRGGSWGINPFYCRSAVRLDDSRDYYINGVGFRVVASPQDFLALCSFALLPFSLP